MEDLGNKIREIRMAHKELQDHLARQLHVSRQSISNWENNHVIPNVENLQEIYRYYQVSPLYFFDQEAVKEQEEEKKKQNSYKEWIVLIGLCSWAMPVLIPVNFLELLIFKFLVKVPKKDDLLLLSICCFYLAYFMVSKTGEHHLCLFNR